MVDERGGLERAVAVRCAQEVHGEGDRDLVARGDRVVEDRDVQVEGRLIPDRAGLVGPALRTRTVVAVSTG